MDTTAEKFLDQQYANFVLQVKNTANEATTGVQTGCSGT